MARLLTASSLLLAFSLFSALQVGATPIPDPDHHHHHHHHHHNRTEVRRDDVEIMKRDPLASLHESLHELVARQSGTPAPTPANAGPILTGVGQIISGVGSLLTGISAAQQAQRNN